MFRSPPATKKALNGQSRRRNRYQALPSPQLAPAGQEQLRLQAARLREQGRSLNEVAQIRGVMPTTVSEWPTRYREGGVQALRLRIRGRREGEQRE